MNNQNNPLMQEKNIVVAVILSFVTFGIYYLVWLFSVMKKIKLLAGEEPNVAGELLLCVFIPFYSWYWMFTRSKKLAAAGNACGVQLEDKSVVNLILAVIALGFVAVALMQADLNKCARAFVAAAA